MEMAMSSFCVSGLEMNTGGLEVLLIKFPWIPAYCLRGGVVGGEGSNVDIRRDDSRACRIPPLN